VGILLSKLRIKNFRSIESLSIDLGLSNLLIGQNNTGKSNFLRAINIAVGGVTDVSDSDIFVASGERLERTKTAVIDTMFQPTDEQGSIANEFSDFWISVFTTDWIGTDGGSAFVGIRTEIKYDITKDSYIINRRFIQQWGESTDAAQIPNKKSVYNEQMRSLLVSFYMDANRDIVQDLRNKKSYFGRVTSNYNMPENKIKEIEKQLSNVNAMIIESIPTLQQTKERISAIWETIGATSSNVEIAPLARKISDLNKGMDIVMQENGAASFPIMQQGSGTRSWISFLTLSAFVDNQNAKLKADDNEAEQYVMLTMEEPEAHLHPQAQRQLFSQISKFTGQKIVSTHSPSIVAQSVLADTIYFKKRGGKTTAIRYQASGDDDKIGREVINTRADIIFATAVILCEGITEEVALPIFFQGYFKHAPYSLGVSIIGIGGQNYKTYLSLIKNFDTPWFIFSDGENKTISAVKTAVNEVFNMDYKNLSNIVIIENDDDYEKHLIREGYKEAIIAAICGHEEDAEFFESYIKQMNGQKGKGGVPRNYEGDAGREQALEDLCNRHKAEYALPVARQIVSSDDKNKRIPAKIKSLFAELAQKLGLPISTDEEDAK